MDDCIAKLIMDKYGDVGVQLCSEIPASMKHDVYKTEIAVMLKSVPATVGPSILSTLHVSTLLCGSALCLS